MPHSTRRAELGAAPTASYRGGAGSPLVLLHGVTMTWRAWLPVIPALERSHTVFAPTLPGHWGGPPVQLSTPMDIAALTDAVECQLAAAGIDDAHIVGNSLGAYIGLELARRGRARSYVGFSPPAARPPGGMTQITLGALTRSAPLVSRLGPQTVQWLGSQPQRRRWLLGLMHEHPDRLDPSEALHFIEAAARCRMLGPLLVGSRRAPIGIGSGFDRAVGPLRIAWPIRDRILPFQRWGRPLLDLIPTAEYVPLRGVGHVPMSDDPALVAQTILDATAELSRRRSSMS